MEEESQSPVCDVRRARHVHRSPEEPNLRDSPKHISQCCPSKFRAALIVLKSLYDPDLPHIINMDNIKASLQFANDEQLCCATFKALSNPENKDEHELLQDATIAHLINTTNGILDTEPNIFNVLVEKQFGITERQIDLEGLQIKKANEKKGFFKTMSGMLFRNGYMIGTEIPSAVVAGALSVFANSDWNPKSVITDKKRLPVLFVHGLKHNQSGWAVGDKLLQSSKYSGTFGSFYYISYDKVLSNSWNKTIDDFVAIISVKIANILLETGHDQIILVGHSLGGIICSRYAEMLQVHQSHQPVTHVITIGSPFDGSHVANLLKDQKDFLGMSHREIDKQLVLDSPILKEIATAARNADWSGKRKYYCIRSTTDPLVPKHNTFVTKDPRRQFTLESTGHIALLFTPKVWWKIAEWLYSIHLGLKLN